MSGLGNNARYQKKGKPECNELLRHTKLCAPNDIIPSKPYL